MILTEEPTINHGNSHPWLPAFPYYESPAVKFAIGGRYSVGKLVQQPHFLNLHGQV